MSISIGIAAQLGPEAAAELGPAVEAAGFDRLWVNETRGTDALQVAAAAARVTTTLRFATGVIPVDARPAAAILEQLSELRLPSERIAVGVGSGQTGSGALALMTDEVDTLHAGSDVDVLVGALGPKMRRLAAEQSEGVILNWLTPQTAAEHAAEHHGLDAAGEVVLYARTLAEETARAALEKEAARYGSFPKYAANFAREGATPLDTVIDLTHPGAVDRVTAYREAVDEVVLRAVTPSGSSEEHLAFVEAVAHLAE